ncbi:MAG: hypothetical protein QXL96_04225 [Ignisphaera sp.]
MTSHKKRLKLVFIVVIFMIFTMLSFFNTVELIGESNIDNTTTTELYNNTAATSIDTNTHPANIVNQTAFTLTITETKTITLSTTVTSVLIHTTTLTLMATIPGGVPINLVFVFAALIGVLSISIGYFIGYKTSRKPIEEQPTRRRK